MFKIVAQWGEWKGHSWPKVRDTVRMKRRHSKEKQRNRRKKKRDIVGTEKGTDGEIRRCLCVRIITNFLNNMDTLYTCKFSI